MAHILPEVGDKVAIKSFSFTNKNGGTGCSDWEYNEKFSKPTATVTIVHAFEDWETGWIFHGASADEDLTQYMERLASAADQRIFFSEFDVVEVLGG